MLRTGRGQPQARSRPCGRSQLPKPPVPWHIGTDPVVEAPFPHKRFRNEHEPRPCSTLRSPDKPHLPSCPPADASPSGRGLPLLEPRGGAGRASVCSLVGSPFWAAEPCRRTAGLPLQAASPGILQGGRSRVRVPRAPPRRFLSCPYPHPLSATSACHADPGTTLQILLRVPPAAAAASAVTPRMEATLRNFLPRPGRRSSGADRVPHTAFLAYPPGRAGPSAAP